MSDIDLAIRSSKRIESSLTRIYGARGKGLHEKLTSVERKLPVGLVKRIRYVATIRNKLVHDEAYRRIDDRGSFKKAVKSISRELKRMEQRPFPWLWLVVAALLLLGTLAAFYFGFV